MILNTRKCDRKFWELVNEHPIHPQVVDVIKFFGLYGVYRSYRPIIGRSLITSLVERWHPETHTFHIRTGEAMITLQDVEILYGLPVKGNPVVGYEPQRYVVDWQNICQRQLGFTPHPQDFKYSSLMVSALNAQLRLQPRFPDLATQYIANEKARCYMFWMIVGIMLADTSGGLLKLMYLAMLEGITAVGYCSWGSATLACLYRFFLKPPKVPKMKLLDSYHYVRCITRFIIGNPTSSPQQQQGYVPNVMAYETMPHHIHLMVNKAISLGDNPSMEEFYMFLATVRDEGSNWLSYVQKDDRIHVQANYRRDEVMSDHLHPPIHRRGKCGVAGRRVRVVERGREPIEMGEEDQATQDFQAASEYEPTNIEIV
ncbi:hypothetical protein KY290_031422 [Solanum tuberosum]|uniref:Aminotransferase-like plant mobile domain-containing protein n=1 Tax=Solanum tuberosum TaxID=4113 RepID=A0ABQ7U9X0_SOLTU|nr:hypothetical protein KY289_030813 [Solanum tuberosum]KAH0743429.1 hypothetical protein KY290_031422 [Solanum tuberosum]